MEGAVMSARREGQLLGAVGLLACLLAGSVIAQQAGQGVTGRGQYREDQAERRELRREPEQTVQSDGRSDQDRSATRETSPALNDQASMAGVERYLATCLLGKNKSEIELSKIALDKSQNQQVREFAQMLIDDHTQAVQKLQPLAAKT